jgi:hypothetical protein
MLGAELPASARISSMVALPVRRRSLTIFSARRLIEPVTNLLRPDRRVRISGYSLEFSGNRSRK